MDKKVTAALHRIKDDAAEIINAGSDDALSRTRHASEYMAMMIARARAIRAEACKILAGGKL